MSKAPAKESMSRGTYYRARPRELIVIGLDTADGPEHPLYDPRIHLPISEPQIRNVATFGITTPTKAQRFKGTLKLRDGSEVKDPLITVDGRQRVRKARIVEDRQLAAGTDPKDTIMVPVIIEAGDDAHLFAISRVGNVFVADGPLTTAQNVQRYLAMGKSVQDAADAFSVSEQTIRNYQALLEAHKDVIDAMVKEEISTTAALQIVGLPQEQQKEVLEEIKSEERETGKKATVERVKKKVAEKTGKQSKTPKDRIASATNLLQKYGNKPAGEKTKEEMAATLERLCRVLTGVGLDKLCAAEDE